MPHRRSWLAIVVLTLVMLVATAPAGAVPFDGRPKILLHLRGTTSKNPCNVGLLTDCTTATTAGDVATAGSGPFYFAYVLTARGNLADVAGLQFGIDYQDGVVGNSRDGVGLDIFQWINCATLEFAATARPWPEPGAGTLITWDSTVHCQTGETGVAGYFYVGAYGADELRLTPRPVDALAKLADCLAVETRLEPYDLGIVALSPGAAHAGCNPCLETCGPVVLPPDTTPPDRITLTLDSIMGSSLTLRWPSPDEDGPTGFGHWCVSYEMKRSTSLITEANFNTLSDVPNLPTPTNVGFPQFKTINGLTPGETYYFAIRAIDEGHNVGPLSNVVEVTISTSPDSSPPAAVTDLAIGDINSATLLLNWTAPGDDVDVGQAAQYDIRYSLAPITAANFGAASQAEEEPIPGEVGTQESFVLGVLVSGVRYYVALKTLDELSNTSALSNVVTAVTIGPLTLDTTPPAAITDLIVTGSSISHVSLEWTVPGDDNMTGRASFYDLRRSTEPITTANFAAATAVSGEPAPLMPGVRQGMAVGGLVEARRYYFALKTGDEVPNWSGMSNVVNRRTNQQTGDAKLMLHVTAPVSKAPCTNGQLLDCRDAVTEGDLATVGESGPRYFVYLLATDFTELAGVQCGISYDGNRPDGDANLEGIDVHGWTLCASLEITSAGSVPWPRPGSSNTITWDVEHHCQSEATAVAGYFYMTAYSPDWLHITPRSVDGLAKVSNCGGLETIVPTHFLGVASFSAGALVPGGSPCGIGDGLSIQPTTWSRIKTLTGK